MAMLYSILLWALLLLGPGLAAIAIYYPLAISWKIILLAVCLLYSVSPFIIGYIGLILAERFGCQAESGISYKCPEHPSMGEMVTVMVFIGAWGAIITIPSGVLGCIGILIALFF
jgi:hypothetical protein